MISAYRIVDYFFLHPYDLRTLRMPGSTHRKVASKFDHLRPYKRASEPAAVAIYMWQFQQTALTALARRDAVDPAALANDAVWFNRLRVPAELVALTQATTDERAEVFDVLASAIERFPLLGPGGLKDRSGLLDYRYDLKTDVAAA